MNKKSILLIGAGLFGVAAAFTPLAASADSDEEALAFIVGAAVGHVISDGHHVRYVHRPHYRHGSHIRPIRWHARHHALHRHWKRDHDRHDHRRHDRWDRDDRWDRHDRDHDRRGDRDHRRGRGRS